MAWSKNLQNLKRKLRKLNIQVTFHLQVLLLDPQLRPAVGRAGQIGIMGEAKTLSDSVGRCFHHAQHRTAAAFGVTKRPVRIKINMVFFHIFPRRTELLFAVEKPVTFIALPGPGQWIFAPSSRDQGEIHLNTAGSQRVVKCYKILEVTRHHAKSCCLFLVYSGWFFYHFFSVFIQTMLGVASEHASPMTLPLSSKLFKKPPNQIVGHRRKLSGNVLRIFRKPQSQAIRDVFPQCGAILQLSSLLGGFHTQRMAASGRNHQWKIVQCFCPTCFMTVLARYLTGDVGRYCQEHEIEEYCMKLELYEFSIK